MGLTADIYDIFDFSNHIIKEAAALQASITEVSTAVNHFVSLLDNQSGATIVSIRNYITGFAGSIQAIADAVNMAFTYILMVYQGAYALLDADAYAVIGEDTISEIVNAYRNAYLWMDDELDIVKKMYYRVCGFTDVNLPSFEDAFTRMEDFETRERAYLQRLLDTEESFAANELVLLQNLMESSRTYLTGLMPQGYNTVMAPLGVKINGVTDIDASLSGREQQIQDAWVHGFVAGADNTACLQIANHPELYQSILGIYGYRIQNEETINALSSICRETCETYILDEKWQEGWKKIGSGAFALMSGAGALGVAFGEAGTLLTVLGLASGGSSVALGTSELFDGSQDVSISVQGLKYTDAINPLKDLMGEEAYNKAIVISTTTADVVCLAGMVADVVKGIGGESGSKTIDNVIPNVEGVTINPNKLTEYALNPKHPVGGNKARVFESALGYNQSNADDLMKQIYEKLPCSEAVVGKLDQYGQRYTVDISITGPNGNTVNVRTGWIIKTGSDIPELTTIYVKE